MSEPGASVVDPFGWSASRYSMFARERSRPMLDLLAALPRSSASGGLAADLGCGAGHSTELLQARYPAATITGVDTSPDMLAAARARLPGVRFELDEVGRWCESRAPDRYRIILANAVLQWVPDHARLFPALVSKLAPGGWLAVQMPDNLEEPVHRSMREIAAQGPWALKLESASAARTAPGGVDFYHELLRSHGCRAEIWRTTYHHPLRDAAAVVAWFTGSGLRPFLAPLTPEERQEFLRRYEAAVAQALRPMADGQVLLPFPRLFMVAERP